MSNYGWIITKDKIDTDAKGTMGPWDIPAELVEWFEDGSHGIPPFGRVHKFRMLDDDGEIYYYGILVAEDEDFQPLDDFGAPNAGCTMIEYKLDNGTWEVL